jgi:magnesium transporter
VKSNTINIQELISELIKKGDSKALIREIDELSAKEVVHLMGHLNLEEQKKLLLILPPEDAAEVMEEIPEVQAVDIFEELDTKDAAAILNEMESNDQADIIMEFDEEEAQAILAEMAPEEAAHVRKLIEYDFDIAGGLMRTEYFAFDENQTVGEVTENLRTHSEKYRYYRLKYIFVTRSNGELKGVLQMQDMLLAKPATRLSEIILPDVLTVKDNSTLDELIDFFHTYDFLGVPVVDERQILVGVILKGDILEAETERVTQEHLETQGIVGGDELRTMPVFIRAKRRLSWLSVNILLNLIAASVIAYHQDVLSSVIALAVFLPIISDMSGCSGNQAVAVSMRELSLGVVNPGEIFRVWWQEVSVGLINGTVLGLLIGLVAWLWKANVYLGMVVGGALCINTLIAVSLGGTIPLILKGMNIDPALASGPILTTVTDMVGFFLTLSFAAILLSHLGGL